MRIRHTYKPSPDATSRYHARSRSIHIDDGDESVILRIDLDAEPARLTWARQLAFAALTAAATLEDVIVLPADVETDVDA